MFFCLKQYKLHFPLWSNQDNDLSTFAADVHAGKLLCCPAALLPGKLWSRVRAEKGKIKSKSNIWNGNVRVWQCNTARCCIFSIFSIQNCILLFTVLYLVFSIFLVFFSVSKVFFTLLFHIHFYGPDLVCADLVCVLGEAWCGTVSDSMSWRLSPNLHRVAFREHWAIWRLNLMKIIISPRLAA